LRGISEQLALFADDKGIALLNTRGFLTENRKIAEHDYSSE
jgi:hypothetical protein